MPKYTLGGDPPQSRSEQILMGQESGPAQSRLEELLKNGSGGGITPEQIAAAVEAYLDEHPVTVTETDPTVPAWAKAANPPAVPQMATQTNMSDWTQGKTVDAATLRTDFIDAVAQLSDIGEDVDAHASDISDLQTGKVGKTMLLNLLIPILRQGLYGTDQEAAISALETALGGTPPVQTYVITNNLTNVTNSNSATLVISGSAYSAKLTAASGMEMQSVLITMGGNDITSTVYTSSTGNIVIPSVTGNIVITAVAESMIETYTPEMSDGYINVSTGAIGGTSTYKHTEIIPVREGDKVYGTTYDSTYNVTVQRIRARFTAAYDENSTIYPNGGSGDQHDYAIDTPFVVPSGVYGVVFSIVNSLATQVVVYVDKSERVGA